MAGEADAKHIEYLTFVQLADSHILVMLVTERSFSFRGTFMRISSFLSNEVGGKLL